MIKIIILEVIFENIEKYKSKTWYIPVHVIFHVKLENREVMRTKENYALSS